MWNINSLSMIVRKDQVERKKVAVGDPGAMHVSEEAKTKRRSAHVRSPRQPKSCPIMSPLEFDQTSVIPGAASNERGCGIYYCSRSIDLHDELVLHA